MTERKLKLVHSLPPPDHAGGSGDGGDEPPTPEEAREAAARREALEHDEDPLANALVASWRPETLSEADHDALLDRAFGNDDAKPTAAEQREAGALGDALDRMLARGRTSDGTLAAGRDADREALLDLAAALRAAHVPRALEPATNDALVERALAQKAWADAQERARTEKKRGATRRVLPVVMSAVAGVAALAAAAALTLSVAKKESPMASRAAAPAVAAQPAAQTAFIHARSTDDLFDPAVPFPKQGGESARMDRIASARAADLRQNRFAAWGVR